MIGKGRIIDGIRLFSQLSARQGYTIKAFVYLSYTIGWLHHYTQQMSLEILLLENLLPPSTSEIKRKSGS